MHNLENEYLKITATSKGAELLSLINKQTGIEHLWQASPEFWAWHAPILFPVVGRCIDDTILTQGREYKMEKHGFARRSSFILVDQSATSLSYSLTTSSLRSKMYPYNFQLLVHYILEGNQLHQRMEIINHGEESMLYSIGAHPAFNVPFIANEAYSDYYIEFQDDTLLDRHLINEAGYFTGEKAPVLTGSNILPLSQGMFQKDALIFKDLTSRKVTIRSRNHKHSLSVSFSDYKYLGLWAKVNAPFVCIEPWLGCAETDGTKVRFEKKEGIQSLASGKSKTVSLQIEMT
jgi:hypothetical protein